MQPVGGKLNLSAESQSEDHGGDGGGRGCATVGLRDRITKIFIEQHPTTDWFMGCEKKVIGQI